MTTKMMLLLLCGLSAIAPAAALVSDRLPMVVTNLTGQLHIFQDLPLTCANVNESHDASGGRFELTPSEGVDVADGKLFVLTKANVSFVPFTIHRSCLGHNETIHYTEVGVQLNRAVSFTAAPAGPDVFSFAIPKDRFVIYEAAIVNGKPENSDKRPKQDVTGPINFADSTVPMHIVIATKMHFKIGCVDLLLGEECLVDDDYFGTLTADVGHDGPAGFGW